MTMKAKYQPVLDLGESLNIQNGSVSEENGVLKVKGTASTQYEKNILWIQDSSLVYCLRSNFCRCELNFDSRPIV